MRGRSDAGTSVRSERGVGDVERSEGDDECASLRSFRTASRSPNQRAIARFEYPKVAEQGCRTRLGSCADFHSRAPKTGGSSCQPARETNAALHLIIATVAWVFFRPVISIRRFASFGCAADGAHMCKSSRQPCPPNGNCTERRLLDSLQIHALYIVVYRGDQRVCFRPIARNCFGGMR